MKCFKKCIPFTGIISNCFKLHPFPQILLSLYCTMTTGLEKKFEKKCVIGTHDGVFHCDEVLGCFMLKVLYPNATIVRSRDAKILETCDIVIDVGGEYSPQKYRFDHHQRDFQHTMKTLSSELVSDIRLSSAGLVYHHFGKHIVKKIMQTENTEEIDFVYKKVYTNFIQEIDGIDNGIPQFPEEPLYNINSHVSSRISHLNRPWNANPEDFNEADNFDKAMKLVGGELTLYIYRAQNISYPARKIVSDAIQKRFETHASGDIIELKECVPWKDHFFEIEKELKLEPTIKYVLFGSDSGDYRVQGVSVTQKSFVGRKFLPPSWRGLRNEELSKKAGIPDCIFVHSTGFIGGSKTRNGAYQMAVKGMESKEEET